MATFFEWVSFWLHCALEGWLAGWETILLVDGICTVLGAYVYWRKHGFENWEEIVKKIMGWAFLIGLLSFFFTALFVAPFIQYREAKNKRSELNGQNFSILATNVYGSAMVNGSGNNITVGNVYGDTNRPTFGLFYDFWQESRTSRYETNLQKGIITEIVEISKSPGMHGIRPGEVVKLNTNELKLSIVVYGKLSADHIVVELASPWLGESNNVSGANGWVNLGQARILFQSANSNFFDFAHTMRVDFIRPVAPGNYIPLPVLFFPNNSKKTTMPLCFTIIANNSEEFDLRFVVDPKYD